MYRPSKVVRASDTPITAISHFIGSYSSAGVDTWLPVTTDLNPLVDNYAFHASQGQAGRDVVLTSADFAESMKSRLLKNGFVMTILELETMNAQMTELKGRSQALIVSIDQEMKEPN